MFWQRRMFEMPMHTHTQLCRLMLHIYRLYNILSYSFVHIFTPEHNLHDCFYPFTACHGHRCDTAFLSQRLLSSKHLSTAHAGAAWLWRVALAMDYPIIASSKHEKPQLPVDCRLWLKVTTTPSFLPTYWILHVFYMCLPYCASVKQ